MVNNLVNIQDSMKDINVDIAIFINDKEETIEGAASYLNEYGSIANETCLVSLNPQTSANNDCVNIAPGEGKQFRSILNYQFCEELLFPYLFPASVIEFKET